MFLKRTMIYNSIRKTLNKEGYIEVETPILQNPIVGMQQRGDHSQRTTTHLTYHYI